MFTFFIVWFPLCHVSSKFSPTQSNSGSGIFFYKTILWWGMCEIRLKFSHLFSIFIETRDWIVCSDDYLAIIFWFLLGRLRWGLNTHQRWRSRSLHTRTRSVSSYTSPLTRKWLHLLPLIRKCFHHLIGCWGSKNWLYQLIKSLIINKLDILCYFLAVSWSSACVGSQCQLPGEHLLMLRSRLRHQSPLRNTTRILNVIII